MDVVEIVNKAADKCGFRREVYADASLPTLISNIVVLLLFGDVRSTCVASSLILKRYKEMRTGKYLIVCSWPGYRNLFPYVDEYWSVKDLASAQSLASSAESFYNRSDIISNYHRSLNNYFESILTWDDLGFYNGGFTKKYWDTFKDVKVFLPNVPSSTTLPEDFRLEMGKRSGRKIVIFPSKKLESWQNGKLNRLVVHRDFWCAATNRLLEEGFVPVVYQNWFTYDLSSDFADKCLWLNSSDVGQTLSGMRWADCVLDIHSGISRLALAARAPSLIVDERLRYIETKNYELDDLTNLTPRQYLFSFSTMLMSGNAMEWNTSLLDGIVSRLNKWLPTIDRTACGSPTEYYDVADYDHVRRHKVKRLGIRFIKKH